MIEFNAPAAFPAPPAAGEFHVWKTELELAEQTRDRLWAWLSADERERATAFVFDRDRFHFIAARGILRLLLGRYLDCAPLTPRFTYNTEGRPTLAHPTGDGTGPLFFNLSHSQGRAMYVFSRLTSCGIDLEIPRERNQQIDFLGIADFFTPGEGQHLRNTPPGQLPDEFLRFWTGKEAVLKAIGKGLSLELSSLEIEADPDGLRPVIVQNRAEEAARWQLIELRPWPVGRSTLAYRGEPGGRIVAFAPGEAWILEQMNQVNGS